MKKHTFDSIQQRVEAIGITPDLANRLLKPCGSRSIHDAERQALHFAGFSQETSPADLLYWFESAGPNSVGARGLLRTFAEEPETQIYLTPSVIIAIALSAQVYIYTHSISRILVPDYRVDDIRKIMRSPTEIYGINPYHFEEIVAFTYELAGLKSFVTRKSGDGGADILVWHPTGLSEPPLKAIQVKRFRSSNRVGLAEVQRMKGVVIDFGARSGEIVTTSWFTAGAALSANRAPLTIQLTDFDKFIQRLDAICNDLS